MGILVGLLIILLLNIYLFVWTLLVDLHDVLLTLVQKLAADVLFVSRLRPLFYICGNTRIFWEDLVLEELFPERHCFDVGHCHVNELRFLVEANIIITYIRVLTKLNANLELLLGQTLCH